MNSSYIIHNLTRVTHFLDYIFLNSNRPILFKNAALNANCFTPL